MPPTKELVLNRVVHNIRALKVLLGPLLLMPMQTLLSFVSILLENCSDAALNQLLSAYLEHGARGRGTKGKRESLMYRAYLLIRGVAFETMKCEMVFQGVRYRPEEVDHIMFTMGQMFQATKAPDLKKHEGVEEKLKGYQMKHGRSDTWLNQLRKTNSLVTHPFMVAWLCEYNRNAHKDAPPTEPTQLVLGNELVLTEEEEGDLLVRLRGLYGSQQPDWCLYNATIEVKELKRLDPEQEDPKAKYLNSDIIMAYFEILWDAFRRIERFEHGQMFMSDFLYTKLNGDGLNMDTWARWAKRAKLNFKKWFKLDLGEGLTKVTKIYCPCNVLAGTHWGLAVVDLQEKIVLYYDSLLHKGAEEIESVRENLKKLIPLVRPDDDASSWGFNQVQVPRQTNGFDCGLYVCKFARCLAFGETIADHHVSQIRYRVMKEILERTVEGSPPPISS